MMWWLLTKSVSLEGIPQRRSLKQIQTLLEPLLLGCIDSPSADDGLRFRSSVSTDSILLESGAKGNARSEDVVSSIEVEMNYEQLSTNIPIKRLNTIVKSSR